MPGLTTGAFQNPYAGFGLDRPYQDGIFVRSQFMENLRIEERENELKILKMFGENLGAGKSNPGERFLVPTQSNPAVGDLLDSVTTGNYAFPDYIATDAPTIANTNPFARTIGSGATVLGIPLPLQAANEGQIELQVNQYRGTALLFTKRFIETAMGYIKNPTSAYSKKIKYVLMNDIETFSWLTWLFTGPITAVIGDYGTGANSFTDSIGVSNQTNYQLTRTLTAINSGTNLITPTSTGTSAVAFSNSGNARFSNYNVPWLYGSTNADISFDTVARLDENFNLRNVPDEGRGILCNSKGYNDIKYLPQFSSADYYDSNGVYKSGKVGGKILNFDVDYSNVIQPATANSNVIYNIAGAKGALLYQISNQPDLIIEDMLRKPQLAIIVMATTRYGAVIQRPDHAAVIQTRTRS